MNTCINGGLVLADRLLASLTLLWIARVYYIAYNSYRFLFKFQGISTSRILLADSPSETPISSPLIPISAARAGKTEGQTENQAVKPKPATVQAILKGIKQVMLLSGSSISQS